MAFISLSCDDGSEEILYGKITPGANPPVVASVTPTDSAYAVVDLITLNGSGFSTVLKDNVVYLGKDTCQVIEATENYLRVYPPYIEGDSLNLWASVRGAAKYSDPILYKLKKPDYELNAVSGRAPYGIAYGQDGYIYVSITEFGTKKGIIRFNPNNPAATEEQYSNPGAETFNSIIKIAPGGKIIAVRANMKALFEIVQSGTPIVWISSGMGNMEDFDFDQNQYVWAGGKGNTAIYRITYSDKTLKTYPFTGDIKSVRIFNSYLYLAATRDNKEYIIRYPIESNNDLGAEETVYNFTDDSGYPTNRINAITIDNLGNIYLGTDAPVGIFVLTQAGQFYPLYPNLTKYGLYGGSATRFTWGAGDELYYVRATTKGTSAYQEIIRLNVTNTSAPYYGY